MSRFDLLYSDSNIDRGQSEVIGTVLLIGLTILAIGGIVIIGAPALDETRQNIEVRSAEQAMTLFDSRAALVALGKSNAQVIDLGQATRGHYEVNESTGWIKISHVNYTGNNGGEVETLLTKTEMGSVSYQTGQTYVAYQGGGVWLARGNGSVMLSPPEFHYRGETVTFPFIRVTGHDSASGLVQARILENGTSIPVFPNRSATYDGTSRTYENPIENGTVQIKLHSRYYRGWASYFRQRTTAGVTVYDSNQTVLVELVTPGPQGDFEMPRQGNALKIRGMKSHTLKNFTFTIYPDEDNADFANLEWSMYAEKATGETLEFSLHTPKGKLCKNGERTKAPLTAIIYYTNGSQYYHGWKRQNISSTSHEKFSVHCPGDSGVKHIHANWTGAVDFTYQSVDGQNLHSTVSGSLEPTADFSHSGVSWETGSEATYRSGDTAPVWKPTKHYMAQMSPSFDLVARDFAHGRGASGSISERSSYGFIRYQTTGRVVTYLHISRNGVKVDIE